jgi:glycosyltransferase involved in cell wall biosynthesis
MTQPRPTIALCMIVKNEEQFIGTCLDSARSFVDEIVVVDTGSTDRTIELALERGARVEHFEWINDFAAARNYAVDVAKSDWILMLDADEELAPESGPLLRLYAAALPQGVFGYAVQIVNFVAGSRTIAHYMTRFFPKHPRLRFIGSIHEELKPMPGVSGTITHVPDLRIIHHGYEPDLYAARNKDQRNMRLLEQELEVQPHDARLLYYVAQQHCSQKRYEAAIPFLKRFLDNKGQLRGAFTEEVYRMWLEAVLNLDRDDEVAQVAAQAGAAGALSSYAHEMLGHHHLNRGRVREALEAFKASADPSAPVGLWGRPSGSEWEILLKVSDTHWMLGEHKRALRLADKLFDSVPADQQYDLALQIARNCKLAGYYGPAQRWAARARQCAAQDLTVHLDLLDFELGLPADTPRTDSFVNIDHALATRDWQAAYDAALEMPLDDMATISRLYRVGVALIDLEAPDAAVDVLARAADSQIQEPRVYWALVRAFNALGRHEDAANALALLESMQAADPLRAAA